MSPKIRDEHADWLAARIGAGDFTLRGLVAEFAVDVPRVEYPAAWRFVHRAESVRSSVYD